MSTGFKVDVGGRDLGAGYEFQAFHGREGQYGVREEGSVRAGGYRTDAHSSATFVPGRAVRVEQGRSTELYGVGQHEHSSRTAGTEGVDITDAGGFHLGGARFGESHRTTLDGQGLQGRHVYEMPGVKYTEGGGISKDGTFSYSAGINDADCDCSCNPCEVAEVIGGCFCGIFGLIAERFK